MAKLPSDREVAAHTISKEVPIVAELLDEITRLRTESRPFEIPHDAHVLDTTCEACGTPMSVIVPSDPLRQAPATFCPPCGGGCECVSYRIVIKCDGRWLDTNRFNCEGAKRVCRCKRCASEPEESERFHVCEHPEHVSAAAFRHKKIRDREMVL